MNMSSEKKAQEALLMRKHNGRLPVPFLQAEEHC